MVTDGPPAWKLVVTTGKLHPGETEAQAALREVPEETGLRCRLGHEVGTSAYQHDRRLLDGWQPAR